MAKGKVWNTSIVLIICLALWLLIIPKAYAERETFTVPPFNEVVRTAGLAEGEKVSGSINVTGGSGNDIDFYVTDPNGDTILQYDRATQKSFSFTALTTGTYTMHFSNTFSIFSSKSVTLDYSIGHLIFGIPQETFYFLVIIIAVVIVVLAVIVVLLRRKSASNDDGN